MSLIVVQVGQCGNQLGEIFLDKFFSNSLSKVILKQFAAPQVESVAPSSILFRLSSTDSKTWIARSVAVDSEVKVVRKLFSRNNERKWIYHPRNAVSLESGAGNNWAYAYKRIGSKLYEEASRRIRLEVEHCGDNFGGFIIIHSLAGGTGSGLGSYFTEKLRKEYPNALTLNIAVWPFDSSSGSSEITVQFYNIVLSLATLYQNSNAILLVRNENIYKVCSERFGMTSKVSFEQINDIIAFMLCGIFLPCSTVSGDKKRVNLLEDIINPAVPDHRLKLLNLSFAPMVSKECRAFSIHKWKNILKDLAQMLLTNSVLDERLNWTVNLNSSQKCRDKILESPDRYSLIVANVLFLRGFKEDHEIIKDAINETGWNSSEWKHSSAPSDSSTAFKTTRSIDGYDKLLFCLSNSTANVRSIQTTLRRAKEMFKIRAYVHWYEKYGISSSKFEQAFFILNNFVDFYYSNNEVP